MIVMMSHLFVVSVVYCGRFQNGESAPCESIKRGGRRSAQDSREKDMDTLTSHLHHRRAAGAHVGNLVLARVLDIEHDLKLARVRVISAGGTYARRDGIADAADEDLCKACRAGSAVGRANGVCISLACSDGDITCASESFF
jgi:hypothetical protein